MESKTTDNLNRTSSRSTSHCDTLDCIVATDDLDLGNDALMKQNERPRESVSSRRDRTPKYSIDTPPSRSSRHSPISTTRKRHSSPRSTSSSRTRHYYHVNPKSYRTSPPSPSPPPPAPPPPLMMPTSSSTHRYYRPGPSSKRPHSKSRSPHERRAPTHRSRVETTKDRSTSDIYKSNTATDDKKISKYLSASQETGDLSFVSEDELTKPQETPTNSTAINESTPNVANAKVHSTPSLPTVQQPNANESLLDTSTSTQDPELSIFAASTLSTNNNNNNNNNSISTPMPTSTSLPRNNFIETIDLISKFKAMQASPSNDPQVEACSKEIFKLIQKQIELQKIELNCREREIRLRERELVEREKRFDEKSSDTPIATATVTEVPITNKLATTEEKSEPKTDTAIDQDVKDISEEETSTTSISNTVDTSKVNIPSKPASDQPSVTRKKIGKSRFSPSDVDPAAFLSQENPTVDLGQDEHNDNLTSTSINPSNPAKKSTISKVTPPTDSAMCLVDTDLKVTSSNSCRKVEIQSSHMDRTSASKGPSNDLRYTLGKNRFKQSNNHDDNSTNGSPIDNDDEPMSTINKTIPSKIQTTRDDKQQSHDYPRSVTSTMIETFIDDSIGKRDSRRHPQSRTNHSRQQQYSGQISSSSNNSAKGRSYIHDSSSHSAPKYGLNPKRQETDDLRSRLFDHKHPKPSRTTHRNNY